MSKKATLGQQRVKAEFNPAKSDTVDEIKNASAKMIDIAVDKVYKDSEFGDLKK